MFDKAGKGLEMKREQPLKGRSLEKAVIEAEVILTACFHPLYHPGAIDVGGKAAKIARPSFFDHPPAIKYLYEVMQKLGSAKYNENIPFILRRVLREGKKRRRV